MIEHMNQTPESDLLTVAEVAGRLRVSSMTVRRWIADERLPAIKIGRTHRVEAAALDALMVQHRTSSPLVVRPGGAK